MKIFCFPPSQRASFFFFAQGPQNSLGGPAKKSTAFLPRSAPHFSFLPKDLRILSEALQRNLQHSSLAARLIFLFCPRTSEFSRGPCKEIYSIPPSQRASFFFFAQEPQNSLGGPAKKSTAFLPRSAPHFSFLPKDLRILSEALQRNLQHSSLAARLIFLFCPRTSEFSRRPCKEIYSIPPSQRASFFFFAQGPQNSLGGPAKKSTAFLPRSAPHFSFLPKNLRILSEALQRNLQHSQQF